MTLYFVTGNGYKFAEAKAIIPNLERLALDLPEIQEMDQRKIIKRKLDAAREYARGDIIVEDVALSIDCWNGLPGPLVKWFLNTMGKEGIAHNVLMHENHRATAICVIGYASGQEKRYFEGSVVGRIVAPRGKTRFGWDHIFVPDGHAKTYAEMSPDEKNAISHRRKALEKLKEYIASNK